MDSQSPSPQPAAPTDPYFKRLLFICEYYLSIGLYATCRQFAAKAQIYNPNHPNPSQILAICSILIAASSPNQTDWYSILQLPQLTEDQNAIAQNYNHLLSLVNPEKNHYPSAAEAREWISKAFSILSDARGKALVDNNLRAEANSQRNGVTFWTRCPYCSYVYEYDKTYENCSLRCQNITCRLPFEASPLQGSATPPSELVNNGVYLYEPGKETGSGTESWKLLDPLALVFTPSEMRDSGSKS